MTTARDDYPLASCLAEYSPSHARQREVSAALDEIDRLRRWQREATEVLQAWDLCFDAVRDHPSVTLGESRSAAVLRVLLEYRSHLCAPAQTPCSRPHQPG